MADKIISTFTTLSNDFFRTRELGFTEQLSSGHKFIIEALRQGQFVKIIDPYFKTKEDASIFMDKIYWLNELLRKKEQAIARLEDSFEKSIAGTEEFELCCLLEEMPIYDYQISDDDHPRAIVEIGYTNRNFHIFLAKYGYPTDIYSIYICNYGNNYDVIGVGRNGERGLYRSSDLVDEKRGGVQYKYLLESNFNISFERFIQS